MDDQKAVACDVRSTGRVFTLYVDGTPVSETVKKELQEKGYRVEALRVYTEADRIRRGLLELPAVDTGYNTFYGITEIRAYLGVGLAR